MEVIFTLLRTLCFKLITVVYLSTNLKQWMIIFMQFISVGRWYGHEKCMQKLTCCKKVNFCTLMAAVYENYESWGIWLNYA